MNSKQILLEKTRKEIERDGRKGANYVPSNQHLGKNRYQRRLHSSVSKSVANYNKIDMNKLFFKNVLDVDIEVKGETDTYLVKISFNNFLDKLHDRLHANNDQLDLRIVTRALVDAFNSDDVLVSCTCPDFKYRFAYQATKQGYNSGVAEIRPINKNVIHAGNSKDDPNGLKAGNYYEDRGGACKHILLCISNNTWLIKVSSVVFNYVNYMEKHYQKQYADIIFPAIYEMDYEEYQTSMFDDEDNDTLETDSDLIDKSNIYARDKNKFKAGNKEGIRFAKSKEDDGKQIDFDNLLGDEEEQ